MDATKGPRVSKSRRSHWSQCLEYTLRSLLFAGTNFSELGMQRIWGVLILTF